MKVAQAKTPAAYSRIFSIGIGLDKPSFRRENRYYAHRDFDANGTQVPNLWRNAYNMGFAMHTPLLGIGFYPADRWEVAIGAGRRTFGEASFSSLTVARVYINASYRPALGFSRRFRPVCGLQFSVDIRDYYDYSNELFDYEQVSSTLSAGVLTGLRLATGRVLWGVDLTTLLLSNTAGRFHIIRDPTFYPPGSELEITGDYGHTLGLPEALEVGYAFVHLAVHCSFTIIER